MTPGTFTLEPSPGSRIVVDHLEGSAPCYVYMHGFTSERVGEKSNALLSHALRRDRACVRFDFRGHGQSSGELGTVTVSELIQDGSAVLDYVGSSILVGSSLGGLIAGWVAARHQDLVQGLVLISPAFGYLSRMAAHPQEEEMVLAPSEETRVRLHRRVLEDAALYDEQSLPTRLSMPVLLVHGELDTTVPAEVSRRCFERIPHDRKMLWVVPGGDHRLNHPIQEVYRKMDELLG